MKNICKTHYSHDNATFNLFLLHFIFSVSSILISQLVTKATKKVDHVKEKNKKNTNNEQREKIK